MKGAPLTDKKGNPRSEYFFALAIPKTSPEWGPFWQQIATLAQQSYPNGEWNKPTFKWKYINGDSPEQADKEAFKGCHVIKLKSSFAPRVYTKGGTSQIVDPEQVKRGHYIRAYISIAPNLDAMYPGLYLNPNMVEFIAYGEEITSGPSGDEVFGAAPAAYVPPGASATPVGGTPLATPGGVPGGVASPPATPGAPPAGPAAPPAGPATPGAPPAGPAVPGGVQPAQDFLRGPQPPLGYVMAPKAGNYTYAQYMQTGKWTDELLIAQGYLVKDDIPY